MSIEEQINELIIQMENRGFEFECDGPGMIGFWGPRDENDDRTYKTFKDWDDVENFIDNNKID